MGSAQLAPLWAWSIPPFISQGCLVLKSGHLPVGDQTERSGLSAAIKPTALSVCSPVAHQLKCKHAHVYRLDLPAWIPPKEMPFLAAQNGRVLAELQVLATECQK